MIRAHAVADVRAAEHAEMAGLPDGALMQRAAAALAAACTAQLHTRAGRVYGSRVAVLVGPGNNGGDALFAGARLASRGARVDALLTTSEVHAGGLAAVRAAGGRAVDVERDTAAAHGAVLGADLVVDGLLGLGGRPGLRAPAVALLELRPPGVPVVAVDLPSGVDPDTGEVPGPHAWADLTVTFGTAKPCLLLPPAARAAGRVQVVDLGLEPHLPDPAVERLETADVARLWPRPRPDDHKYTRGVVGVVAGSSTYTGAAVLVVGAALRAGAGMVRYLGPAHPTELVRQRWPEVVPGPGRVQAWVLGSGVDPGSEDGQRRAIEDALTSGDPCAVDAGALGMLPDRVRGPTLLTPHAGELATLLSARDIPTDRDDVERRPLHHARLAATSTGATVLLKGAVTLVVAPDGRVRSQADAPPELATAGAGDVLAGIAGTLLAAGLDPLDAGSLAALVHGRAAAAAGRGGPIRASDVTDALPGVLAELLRRRTTRT